MSVCVHTTKATTITFAFTKTIKKTAKYEFLYVENFFFLEIQAASMQTKIKTKREEATNFGSTFNFFLALFSYRHVCLVNSDKEIFFIISGL